MVTDDCWFRKHGHQWLLAHHAETTMYVPGFNTNTLAWQKWEKGTYQPIAPVWCTIINAQNIYSQYPVCGLYLTWKCDNLWTLTYEVRWGLGSSAFQLASIQSNAFPQVWTGISGTRCWVTGAWHTLARDTRSTPNSVPQCPRQPTRVTHTSRLVLTIFESDMSMFV